MRERVLDDLHRKRSRPSPASAIKSSPMSAKRFLDCVGLQKQHGVTATLCAGASRDTRQ
jgi:hypothetical protein